ncbi:MAG: 4Fe-4S binding protein [Candidatus Bathyarchaeota archaeon]
MVVKIKIDELQCNSCKKCVKTCSFGVLEWFEEQPIVTNPNECSACLECKKVCPNNAITIEEK